MQQAMRMRPQNLPCNLMGFLAKTVGALLAFVFAALWSRVILALLQDLAEGIVSYSVAGKSGHRGAS